MQLVLKGRAFPEMWNLVTFSVIRTDFREE